MKRHLVLGNSSREESLVWQLAVERLELSLSVVWAQTLEEVERALAKHRARFLVVSGGFPADALADLLSNFRMAEPQGGVLVTGPASLDRQLHEALGVVAVIRPPDSVDEAEAALALFDLGRREASALSGSLAAHSLAELVQLKCMHARPSVLRLRESARIGYVYISDSAVIHAEAGARVGAEAFDEMMTWTTGSFEELPEFGAPERTIHLSWQQLLLESAHRRDEAAAGSELLT